MQKPIKSRHGLTRCGACRAHIHAAERPSATVCPFCGANLLSGAPLRSLPTGRGGLLAASLFAMSMAGCGGSDATQANEPTTVDEGSASADDGSNTNDDGSGTGDDGSSSGDDGEEYSDTPPGDVGPVALYGIAPDEYQEQAPDDHAASPRYGIAPSPR